MDNRIDVGSLALGLVAGAAILAVALRWTGPQEPPASSATAGADATALEQIVRLERTRTRQVQSMLDSILGCGRAVAKVAVLAWDHVGGAPRRMSLGVGIDESKVVLDPNSSQVFETHRSAEERDMVEMLARAAGGIDIARGDHSTVFNLPIDKTAQIRLQSMHNSEQRQRLALAIILLVAAGALSFFKRDPHRGNRSAAAWLAAGIALLLVIPGWIPIRDAVVVGVGLYLAIIGCQGLLSKRST